MNWFLHLALCMNDDPTTASVREELRAFLQRSQLYGRPGFLIRRLHQIHIGLFAEETESFNITPVQYSLLTALDEHGEMDQGTLALAIGLERTSVAEVLPRLEARGVVERRPSPQDKRVRLVRMTRRGRTLISRMQDAVTRAHDRTIEALPAAQREQFLLHLIQLVEANNERSVAPLKLR